MALPIAFVAIGLGFLLVLFFLAVFVGGAFLIGYLVGRSAGRREAQRGFPIIPADPNHPA